MSFTGYQDRGSDVRSVVYEDGDIYLGADDDLPYAILSYANGEGYKDHLSVNTEGELSRTDLRNANMTEFKFKSPSSVPKGSETHSGADVGIFSSGIFFQGYGVWGLRILPFLALYDIINN